MGFWNFCYGFALAFLAAGFYLRTRGRLGAGRFAVLAVLAVLLYLAHIVALAGAAIAMGSVLAWRAHVSLVSRAREPGCAASWYVAATRGAGCALVAAAGPGVALALVWIAAHREHVASRIPFLELASKLAVGYALVSIDRRELLLSAMVMLAMFVAVGAPAARALRARAAAPRPGRLARRRRAVRGPLLRRAGRGRGRRARLRPVRLVRARVGGRVDRHRHRARDVAPARRGRPGGDRGRRARRAAPEAARPVRPDGRVRLGEARDRRGPGAPAARALSARPARRRRPAARVPREAVPARHGLDRRRAWRGRSEEQPGRTPISVRCGFRRT